MDTFYDIDKILDYGRQTAKSKCGLAVNGGKKTAREEWVRLCWCLKVLNYDFDTFAALSWATEKECLEKWRDERTPGKYIHTADDALQSIFGMAKTAWGEEFCRDNFSLGRSFNPCSAPRRASAAEDFRNISVGDQAEAATPQPPRKIRYIGEDRLAQFAADAPRTDLYSFLCSVYGEERTRAAFVRYRVGAHRPYPSKLSTFRKRGLNPNTDLFRAAFPLINRENKCLDIRLTPYDGTGHRIREGEPGVISLQGLNRTPADQKGGQCLFGEHLAGMAADGIVGIVESEKTAMVASIALPGSVWMATLGSTGLKEDMLSRIREMDIKVFPDLDAMGSWKGLCDHLRSIGFNITFCGDYIQRHATPGTKEDLADILIREAAREKGVSDGE